MCQRDRLKVLLSNATFNIDDAGVFCRTQWKIPWKVWYIYRLLLTIYYVGFLVCLLLLWLFLAPRAGSYVWIYLTHWTLVLFTVYTLVAFVNVRKDRQHGRYYHSTDGEERRILQSVGGIELSRRHKLQWSLMTICTNISIIITIVYWSFLQVPLPVIYDLTAHIFPSVLGIIDIVMTPIPVKVEQVVYPMAYAAVYAVFTLIYWAAGGTNNLGESAIYPVILDYEMPGTTCITWVCVAGALIACQVLLWGIFKVKMAAISRYSKTNDGDPLSGGPVNNGKEDTGIRGIESGIENQQPPIPDRDEEESESTTSPGTKVL